MRASGMNELTEKELKIAEKNNLIECYVGEDGEFIYEKKKTTKQYTEKELFALNKEQQIKMLNKFGIEPANLEKDRVKQILEAQK